MTRPSMLVKMDLAEGYDPIVDGLSLRDTFIIYKQASVWRMDYVGGTYVMRFSKVLGTSGAMNRNCVGRGGRLSLRPDWLGHHRA